MGEVHNEWTSGRATPPEPVAPAVPKPPAASAAPAAPGLPYPRTSNEPAPPSKPAPRTGREPKLWLALGAAAALLILFVVVLSGRDSNRSSTVPSSTVPPLEVEDGTVACEWTGGSSIAGAAGFTTPEGRVVWISTAEGNVVRIVRRGTNNEIESCTVDLNLKDG